MAKKAFKAESKRLLDLMIHSIYTHKEIFLRELISNASDAIDKSYHKALLAGGSVDKARYRITLEPNKENRTLVLSDNGIGMTKEELEKNLGTIAASGSFTFKEEQGTSEDVDIIGQFGVGFYSAFMIADRVTVVSKAEGTDEAWIWESTGADGYTIKEGELEAPGTKITLHIKEDAEEERYSDYLEPYRLKALIKKHSDFIRHPILMEMTKSRLKEGTEDQYEEVKEEETLNSMVPIWKKNRKDLTDEDYKNFYQEKHYGFDEPLRHIHTNAEGAVEYRSILYIPSSIPYNYYTKEFEKGLELYSRGVLIMNRCSDLLPDHFSFVKGLVDSEDLSLNISRELLQHDRQLKLIAGNISKQIRKELLDLLETDREKYETFFDAFGRQLKYGAYAEYGTHKEELEDLLLFHSSKEKKYVTLKEYVDRMPEGQKHIYYAVGDDLDRIARMPQTERVLEAGFEILYLKEDIDEFALKILSAYKEKDFRNISGGDLGLEEHLLDKGTPDPSEEDAKVLAKMKELLEGKVKDVVVSHRLKTHPVCLTNEGDISIEMEKILQAMPDAPGIKADKVLELNLEHRVFTSLKESLGKDEERFALLTGLLYDQALLIEGLPIEDPVAFSNHIWELMA